MTVPPAVVAANRAQLAALVATNVLGQNTPAIAVTEALYGEMWAQDASAMYGYAGSSAAAATVTPFSSPPQTTSPAARQAKGGAVSSSHRQLSGHRCAVDVDAGGLYPSQHLESTRVAAVGSLGQSLCAWVEYGHDRDRGVLESPVRPESVGLR